MEDVVQDFDVGLARLRTELQGRSHLSQGTRLIAVERLEEYRRAHAAQMLSDLAQAGEQQVVLKRCRVEGGTQVGERRRAVVGRRYDTAGAELFGDVE